jgi:hypothetical protein
MRWQLGKRRSVRWAVTSQIVAGITSLNGPMNKDHWQARAQIHIVQRDAVSDVTPCGSRCTLVVLHQAAACDHYQNRCKAQDAKFGGTDCWSLFHSLCEPLFGEIREKLNSFN